MSAPINTNNLQTLQTMNQQVPQRGLAVSLLIDMTANNGDYTLDLSQYEWQNKFDFVQSVFIDLSETAAALVLTDLTTGHSIVAEGHTQGWYNILSQSPSRLRIQNVGGPSDLKIFLSNLPIPGVVWSATHP